jgi:UDP-glucose 4-epimerase
MSKILITGISGLLGNSLAQVLQKQGHEVVGVARTNRLDFKGKMYLVDLADTTRPSAAEWVFQTEKPDVVYHLAANAAEAMSQKSPLDMTKRNLFMSVNVLNEGIKAGVQKFVYASSVSVYGDASTPYMENSQPLPKDVYGINKYAFEQVLKVMSKVHGIDYTILRPHNIFGPGQNMNDLSKNVVAIFMRKLLEGEGYTILGGNDVRRAFSYVEDVAEVFAVAKDKLSKVTMNVGSTIPSTIQELSNALRDISGIDVPIDYKSLRDQEISEFIADHTNQNAMVSYRETPFYVGLTKTWEWCKQQELKPVINHYKELNV